MGLLLGGFSDAEKFNVGSLLAGNFRQSWMNKVNEKEEGDMVWVFLSPCYMATSLWYFWEVYNMTTKTVLSIDGKLRHFTPTGFYSPLVKVPWEGPLPPPTVSSRLHLYTGLMSPRNCVRMWKEKWNSCRCMLTALSSYGTAHHKGQDPGGLLCVVETSVMLKTELSCWEMKRNLFPC